MRKITRKLFEIFFVEDRIKIPLFAALSMIIPISLRADPVAAAAVSFSLLAFLYGCAIKHRLEDMKNA